MPGMQGARACTGQSPAGTGAPGRPRILLLTYALATLELTCLFMQFSILPVSASSPGRWPPACHLLAHLCHGGDKGWGPDAAPAPLAGGPLPHWS